MKESLTNLCESFVANIELIYRQKGFKIVSTKIMPMCSYMYITSGKAVEPERLLECLKLLESRGGGALSGMRDAFQAPHACSLAVSSDPAVTMDSDVMIFEKLKKVCACSCGYVSVGILYVRAGAGHVLDCRSVASPGMKTGHKVSARSMGMLAYKALWYPG